MSIPSKRRRLIEATGSMTERRTTVPGFGIIGSRGLAVDVAPISSDLG
jgi:hypothetical protein